jgi:3-hydroxyacyl-[acyl-carrier-protein] dehydratase
MQENSKGLTTGTARLRFAVGHKAADGHFPGNPIIPGAVLLRDIVAAIAGDSARCRDIRSAKFHHPVRPGDTLVVSWTEDPAGEVRFSCSIEGSTDAAVTGGFRLAPH